MIARLFGLLAALALAGCDAAEPEREWPAPSPALWEVTAGSGQTAWLFGTVHALPDNVRWRSPALEAVIEEAGLLVVEISDPGNAGGVETFLALAETPGQPALSRRVTDSERPALTALMKDAGAEDGDFSEMETWAAALMLASAVSEGDPANGVDRALVAQMDHILALEDRAGQLQIFDDLPARHQSSLLAATAFEAQQHDPHAAIEAWLTGDLDQLRVMGETGILGDAHLREALLDSRNHVWIARITPMIEAGDRPLIAVGAAHMLGDTGLVAQLEARGFTVRRIQ